MIFTHRNQKIIEEGGDKIKSFATFYDEFKCDRGFVSMMFYPLFFLRRYCYILGLYYLEDYPLIQVIVNSSFSVLTLSYLIAYKPFIEKANNVVNIASETFISLMFILSGCFLIDMPSNIDNILGKSLLLLAVLVVLVILGSVIVKIISAIKSCKRKKRYTQVSQDPQSAPGTIIVYRSPDIRPSSDVLSKAESDGRRKESLKDARHLFENN